MNIKVSIVIPTLNSAKTIKRCLNSVIQQTYKNWEVIIIDANSKDKTLQIIKSFNLEKIKIFKISSKKSISAARYLGVKKSKGSYIAFLDSDDSWSKIKLGLQIKKIGKKINFICTNFDLKNKNKVFKIKNNKILLNIDDLIYNRPIALSSVMIKKSIIKKTMEKNLSINYAEDFYWWSDILKSGHKCYLIQKRITQIYIHSENRSVKFIKNYMSLINIYKNNFNYGNLKIFFVFCILAINTFSKNLFKFKNFN